MIKSVDEFRLTDVHLVLSTDKTFARIIRQINDPTSRASREVIAYAIGTVVESGDTEGFTQFSYSPQGSNRFYDSATDETTPTAFDSAWFNTQGAHYK